MGLNYIICLDDEQVLLEFGKVSLEQLFPTTRVIPARTGDEALMWANSETPLFLISDLERPGEDAFSFILKFRQQYPEVPILVFSGYRSCPLVLEQVSKIHYLCKPCTIMELALKVLTIAPGLRMNFAVNNSVPHQ